MASPGYTAVVASNLRDASGTLITNATAVFTPNQSFRTGDPHGQTVIRPISVPVTNGSLSTTLADTSVSNPANVSYRLAVTDNLSGDVLLAKGYTQLQPSGSQWSLDDYVTPSSGPLTLVVAGPQGPEGQPGIASLAQLAAVRAAGPAVNLNPATGWTVGYINATTGVVTADALYQYSPFVPANAGGQMVLSFVPPAGVAGVSFYDESFNFLSGIASGSLTAAVAFAIPNTAAFLRYSYAVSANAPASLMLYNGSTLPASYQAPTTYPTNVIDAQIASLSQQVQTVPDLTSLAKIRSALWNSNLNPTAGWSQGYITATSGTITNDSSYQYSPFIPANSGGQMVFSILTPAGAAGVSFYATDQSFISGLNTSSLAAGTPFAVPANAAFLRYSYAVSVNAPGTLMLFNGITLPASYQSPNWYPTNVVDSMLAALTSPWKGISYGHMGASISFGYKSNVDLAVLMAGKLGATLTYNLSWSGRAPNLLLSNVGSTGVPYPTQGIIQSLDVLSLFDTSYNVTNKDNLGTINDTPSVGTSGSNGITFPNTDSFLAQMQGVLNQLYVWKPTLKIVMFGLWQNCVFTPSYAAGSVPDSTALGYTKNVNAALASISDKYGIPVIDSYHRSGFNPTNLNSLTVDSVHLTTSAANNFVGPWMASELRPFGTK